MLLEACLKPGLRPGFWQVCDKLQTSWRQVSDFSVHNWSQTFSAQNVMGTFLMKLFTVSMCVHRYSVVSNGTLIVRQVTPLDAGVYRCVGLSDSGSAQTFAAQLTIASQSLYLLL